MNENGSFLLQMIPGEANWEIDWEGFEHTLLSCYFQKMKKTEQNPMWHKEGDVWTHTKMVCEELIKLEAYRQLPKKKQQAVFLSALLHDIGKIPCTRLEDGVWKSPNHTLVGSKMAREILWRDFGFCGTKEHQEFRECICNLIRYHSVPLHVLDYSDPEFRLFKIAAQGELVPDFTLSLLQILVEADLRGRFCDSIEDSLEREELCFLLASEGDILDKPGEFASNVTKRAYFLGKKVWRQQELFDDTWGEVILMSGLPGTGKDTWISEHYPNLPMISLDEIRREMKISPKDFQSAVVQEARDRAKDLLRKKQPFVWNATNLSSKIRKKQLDLFEQYHASTRIVFLETSWEKEIARNNNREKTVPETVIGQMLGTLELPKRDEAWKVEWHCV